MIRQALARLRDLPAALAGYAPIFSGPVEAVRFYALHELGRGRAVPVRFRVRGMGNGELWCRPRTTDAYTLLTVFARRHHLPPTGLSRDATIVDLGANVGYASAHLAYMHPGARIVAVEMDAGNLELARLNLAAFGDRCTIVHAAVSAADGIVNYGGVREDGYRIGAGDRTAPALRPETLFERYGIDTVDYLKMDVEGTEHALLHGETGWLNRVRSLHLEVHPPATLDGCILALEHAGFRCTRDTSHWAAIAAVRMPSG